MLEVQQLQQWGLRASSLIMQLYVSFHGSSDCIA